MKNYREVLEKERKKYLKEWSNDAKFFYDNKYYEWMNSKIKDFKLVLEIGCGNGLSTLSLLENGHQVIVVDENIECLKETKKLLNSNNFKAKVIKRESLFRESKWVYEYDYLKIKNSIEEDEVLLIEGDVINDTNLEEWLTDSNINCVTCWLIGSHGARRYNKTIAETRINTPEEYRLLTQNRVYEICDRILKNDGILQIVDRGKKPSNEKDKNIIFESHKDQASVTSLSIKEVDFIEYNHNIENGIGMITETDDGLIQYNNLNGVALISVISKKS